MEVANSSSRLQAKVSCIYLPKVVRYKIEASKTKRLLSDTLTRSVHKILGLFVNGIASCTISCTIIDANYFRAIEIRDTIILENFKQDVPIKQKYSRVSHRSKARPILVNTFEYEKLYDTKRSSKHAKKKSFRSLRIRRVCFTLGKISRDSRDNDQNYSLRCFGYFLHCNRNSARNIS